MPAEPEADDGARRAALGAYLRSRRAAVTPEQLGLPTGRRRRTPGLRREELAHLAGIGVTWYTWLEQGRDIRASEQVLVAISRTLRLDPYEHAHLMTLASGGSTTDVRETECAAVTPPMTEILTKLDPYPTFIRNARGDILAYNRAYSALMGGLDEIPFSERNLLLQGLLNPAWRERIVEWESWAARLVASFHGAWGKHVGEPAWEALVRRLSAESTVFSGLWQRCNVGRDAVTTWGIVGASGEDVAEYAVTEMGVGADVFVVALTPVETGAEQAHSAS
jgi:transcriptional regulator with XRE-family HTH domain